MSNLAETSVAKSPPSVPYGANFIKMRYKIKMLFRSILNKQETILSCIFKIQDTILNIVSIVSCTTLHRVSLYVCTSGVATGWTGGTRPPTCPKDQFWDSSKSDEKLVGEGVGVPLNREKNAVLRLSWR